MDIIFLCVCVPVMSIIEEGDLYKIKNSYNSIIIKKTLMGKRFEYAPFRRSVVVKHAEPLPAALASCTSTGFVPAALLQAICLLIHLGKRWKTQVFGSLPSV